MKKNKEKSLHSQYIAIYIYLPISARVHMCICMCTNMYFCIHRTLFHILRIEGSFSSFLRAYCRHCFKTYFSELSKSVMWWEEADLKSRNQDLKQDKHGHDQHLKERLFKKGTHMQINISGDRFFTRVTFTHVASKEKNAKMILSFLL